MTIETSRRAFILTGSLGLGALATPGFAFAGFGTGFTNNVASGEPGPDSMLLWTRFVSASGAPVRVRAEISTTQDFARVVAGGETITGPWRDFTAKVTVTGLEPGTNYFYRFVADGAVSPIGRTKTLPVGNAKRFGIAVFSCANMPFGYFNAYAHAALRDDIDLAIHTGDYLYEYAKGGYAPVEGAVDGRVPLPETEALTLADYRLRYASYRADPDLQAIHAMKPMLILADDHEIANNTWEGGAQNHQASEREWHMRRAAAIQVWREWMPVSETPWSSYDIGSLATLFRTETRFTARSAGPDIGPMLRSDDPVRALTAFRDGAWQDKAATMMGTEQEAWLARTMQRSVQSGAKWQVVGFGTILAKARVPEQQVDWLKPDATPAQRKRVEQAVMASKLGLPADLDNWGGYPQARERFLKSAQGMGANLIVLCGDSHNSWAFDLAQDGKPVGVEFAGTSVNSPGAERTWAVDPKAIARALVETNAELKWCEMSQRGYMAVTLTPERVTNDYVFTDTVLERSLKASIGHRVTVQRGRNQMA